MGSNKKMHIVIFPELDVYSPYKNLELINLEDNSMNNSWKKPELTVLVRRKSDEIILAGCRMSSGGPDWVYSGCASSDPDTLCSIVGCQG